MTDDQIKHLVNRFLSWRLPPDFNPDAGISYTRPNYAPEVDATPSGTNLLNAMQAEAMIRYLLTEAPADDLDHLSTHVGSYEIRGEEIGKTTHGGRGVGWEFDPSWKPGDGGTKLAAVLGRIFNEGKAARTSEIGALLGVTK